MSLPDDWRAMDPDGVIAIGMTPAPPPRILILTPLKDAVGFLDAYCNRLEVLTYPHDRISLGFLESDSRDDTFSRIVAKLPVLERTFRRARAWKHDFGYQIPPKVPRWENAIQKQRRSVLAKSRNHLLVHALDDEDWVMWLDVDVIEYPADLLERLLATRRDIVQPHCVTSYGGPTFDLNGWRDKGQLHLDDLRAEGTFAELHAVGGTVLWIRADIHRDGLVFPPFPYGHKSRYKREGGNGEIETEGLGMMALDMGYALWGMPHLEVLHRDN
jgi:Anp1